MIEKRSRRDALAVGALAITHSLDSLRLSANEADFSDFPIVDTHQHLWDLSRFRLPWLPQEQDSILSRSYLPEDYLRATSASGVKKAIYMEVDVDQQQQNDEADWVLQLCKSPNSITAGAVISGRPGEAGFAKYIQRFADEPLIKGVRQVLHGSAPAGYCKSDRFVESMQRLGEMDKSFDLCMRPGELLDAVALVDRCPKTRFILDHCGNGPVRSSDQKLIKLWQEGIRELSQRSNVVCKISGIIASAPADWMVADLEPVVSYCIDAFGEDRVMFAGDWPVCLLRATFQQWVDALKIILADRTSTLKRKLFHDNAMRFYSLSEN